MEDLVAFQNQLANRRILVTGHNGFKGSWLCEWLLSLGSEVHGVSLPPNTSPSLFELLKLGSRLEHHILDIRDRKALADRVRQIQPELVFHLAAQPLVRVSYQQPAETWETNVIGTVNLLDAIRQSDSVRACVVVTSDKCYEAAHGESAFVETDPLGGHDPYSASKAATEIAVSSFRRSFFPGSDSCRIASARAGNVIGGGDWSKDRIIVDIVNSITQNRPVNLRNPSFTRPWQHVLDPISGYIVLACKLLRGNGQAYAEPWNFGPESESSVSVEKLTAQAIQHWGTGSLTKPDLDKQPHETEFLSLSCEKAKNQLAWRSAWDLEQAIANTMDWYRCWHNGGDMQKKTRSQISDFCKQARKRKIAWALRETKSDSARIDT